MLVRFSVSMDEKLLARLDEYLERRGYSNRSEAIRDLIREELVEKKWTEGGIVAGAIVMTYDHHKRELVNKMLDIQHDFHNTILSTQHVHLDHHHCLEVIAVKGKAREVENLSNSLKALVGVKHLSLSISATGDETDTNT